jgi:TM2 domain-containing membrane protein YozV
MKLLDSLNRMFRAPKLTWKRIVFALAIAVFADGLQFCLGFIGWAFIDQAIDCIAMILVSWAIGFHILLLPTFVIELIPVLEDLPTWTACTIAVVVLRKRQQRNIPTPDKPTIEI